MEELFQAILQITMHTTEQTLRREFKRHLKK
jgi:hypothetical protein